MELLYFKRDLAHMMPEQLKQVQQEMAKVTATIDPKNVKKEQIPALLSCNY